MSPYCKGENSLVCLTQKNEGQKEIRPLYVDMCSGVKEGEGRGERKGDNFQRERR